MKQVWQSEDTTPAPEPKAETVAEEREDAAASARVPARGTERLFENYRAIIRARALFYPVSYRFGRELGRGRQGVVFVGFRHGARGCVTRHAIKLFDPSVYGTTKKYWTDMGRIAAQVSRLQSVNSPNLVGRDVYEESDGVGYVQMEAIDGLDVHALLRGHHFDRVRQASTAQEWSRFADVIFRFEEGRVRIQPGIAVYIMRQMLRGLEALHDSGFVHCDVKPANVMVDNLGVVKMVDYGRANFVDERVTFLLGSPLYMAPEIHRRERYLIQSDIYSAGLVGIDMLRGEPIAPSADLSEADLLALKADFPRRLPDLLPAHVKRNRDFVALLQRFVDPDPARRFASCQEAESGRGGLAILHKQLTMLGKDSEYDRDLESYLSKLFPNAPRDFRIHEGMMA